MGFARQLRFLLWEIFLIRSRQKLWTFLELCWPLCMFLVLVWVRSSNVTEKHHECHYPAKALPSAGFLPFLQSYFCTIKNTCHRFPFDDGGIGRINDADVSTHRKIGYLVQTFLNVPESTNGLNETLDNVVKVLRSPVSLLDYLQILEQLSKLIRSWNSDAAAENLYATLLSVIADPTGFANSSKDYGASLLKDSVVDFYLNAELYQDALANSELPNAFRNLLSFLRLCRRYVPIWSDTCSEVYSALSEYSGFFDNSTDANATLPRWKKAIEPLAAMLECVATDRFRFVPTERDMEIRAMCLSDMDKFFAGIYFDVDENATGLPPITEYKIRMPSSLIGGTAIRDSVWTSRPRAEPFIDMKYLFFGFSFLQEAVDRAIIEVQTNETQMAGAYMQQFPSPCYQSNAFSRAIERMLPLLMIIAWVCSASLITKNIVYEKEMRLKECIKVMGLTNLVHWIAWFIQTFLFALVSVILFVIVIKYTSFCVLLGFVLLFSVATANSNNTDNRVLLGDVILKSVTAAADDATSVWWVVPMVAAALFAICVVTFGLVKLLDAYGFAIGKFKVEVEFSPIVYLDPVLRQEFMSKIEQWLGGDDVDIKWLPRPSAIGHAFIAVDQVVLYDAQIEGPLDITNDVVMGKIGDRHAAYINSVRNRWLNARFKPHTA